MPRLSCALLALVLAAVPLASGAAAPLRVFSDISYAPLEFVPPGSHAPQGFDIDIAREIGRRLGRTVDYRNRDFKTLIPDLRAGRADLVLSAMSDTGEREKQVDFVDYFLAGSGILTKLGNPSHLSGLDSLCGHTVDVQKGTAQESALAKVADACTAIGLKAPQVLAFDTDDAALAALRGGKSEAHVTDYPVAAYLARTIDGGKSYTIVGRQFGVVPYGIAVAKTQPELRAAVQRALLGMAADGTYDRIVKRWGLEQGALRSAPINAGIKFH